MDTMGLVYHQYRFQNECGEIFMKHIKFINIQYCYGWKFDMQSPSILCVEVNYWEVSLFKASMKTNVDNALKPPHVINPLTKLWHYLVRNVHLRSTFLEYLKLAKIAIVQIIGSMDDERMFWTLNFMKSNIQNKL